MSPLHLSVLIVLCLMVHSIYGSRDKRLVLDSEPDLDLAGEIRQLREEITKLQQRELAKENETALQRAEFMKLLQQQELAKENETAVQRAEFMKLLQSSGSSTYVRWGKNSCPQNGTTMVYKGYMAGKHYHNPGSGANSLCLPDDPTWGNYQDGWQSGRGYIYGTEFEPQSNTIFGRPVGDEDASCAVCKVPGVSVMIPARVNCYPGWKLEYTGYLMAHDVAGDKASDYVCVDADPDFIVRGAASTDGHLLYPVEGRCGALVCPPYYDFRELACVVCSM